MYSWSHCVAVVQELVSKLDPSTEFPVLLGVLKTIHAVVKRYMTFQIEFGVFIC